MAVTYGFYDSLNHDRLYNAQQMSAIFDGIINDGVFMSVGYQFHTVAGTGMQVIVKSGRAWFDSTWTLNDAEYPLSIDAADVLLTRIDAVVLEVNSEVATRANAIKVVKGTPASTPAKPTLTNTSTIHQHALAYVTVAKNTTAITNSMIEIVVGKTETPYVTAILQTTDITDLYNQWEDYFQTWFDNVRSTLDGDVALNLQNQITSLDRKLLLPSTPPKIGLSSGATGDDMFNVLCKVTDLYVWKKTVISSQEVPAAATLGPVQNKNLVVYEGSRQGLYYTSKLIITDDGIITTGNFVSDTIASGTNPDMLIGKYFYMTDPPSVNTSDSGYESVPANKIIYIPTDASGANVTTSDAYEYKYLSKYQIVTGSTPKIPAGTTTTYPVSTNPNAYQEGEYGKAGYTLGDVKTGTFQIGQDATTIAANRAIIKYGASVSVTDTGTASIASESELTVTSDSSQAAVDKLKGKFFRFSQLPFSSSAFSVGKIYFFPANTVFTKQSSGNWYASKYQTVTSHGKTEPEYTIEYLGKLGDKARVQVLSYVGTGTYGINNPNSLTFDFVPKMVTIMDYEALNAAIIMQGQTKYASSITGNNYSGSCNMNGKTLTYHNTRGPSYQLNSTGAKYLVIAIG